MDLGEEAEAIARAASEESGLDDRPNADPLVLAVCYLELRLVPRRGRHSRLVEDRIVYPATASEQQAAYFVAHECGHWLARDTRMRLTIEEEEAVASRAGCALLLPRRAFLRDADACGDDVRALVALWPLVTPTIVRRRLAELAASR
jgi:Zn-dependent peptidase ImmA (M78 family)